MNCEMQDLLRHGTHEDLQKFGKKLGLNIDKNGKVKNLEEILKKRGLK